MVSRLFGIRAKQSGILLITDIKKLAMKRRKIF